MSRSYRRTPVFGATTARSDRPGKQQAHTKLRAATRHLIARLVDPDGVVWPDLTDVSDVWDMPKDGKFRHRGNLPASAMRK